MRSVVLFLFLAPLAACDGGSPLSAFKQPTLDIFADGNSEGSVDIALFYAGYDAASDKNFLTLTNAATATFDGVSIPLSEHGESYRDAIGGTTCLVPDFAASVTNGDTLPALDRPTSTIEVTDGTTKLEAVVQNLCVQRTATLVAPAGATVLHRGDEVKLALAPVTDALPTQVSFYVDAQAVGRVTGTALTAQDHVLSFTVPDLVDHEVAGTVAPEWAPELNIPAGIQRCTAARCTASCGWQLGPQLVVDFAP